MQRLRARSHADARVVRRNPVDSPALCRKRNMEANMDNDRRSLAGLALILGAAVAFALVLFIWTGGVGTKTVQSDADLPKVTSPTTSVPAENTGRR